MIVCVCVCVCVPLKYLTNYRNGAIEIQHNYNNNHPKETTGIVCPRNEWEDTIKKMLNMQLQGHTRRPNKR